MSAEDFWKDRCLDCGHSIHTLSSCHETVPLGGLPGDGPEYCPCSVELLHMEAWIAKRKARDKVGRDRYRTAHPEVHRKSARESMARLRATRIADTDRAGGRG